MKDFDELEHSISELSNEQTRQLIDTQQVFEVLEGTRSTFSRSFRGSMRWGERSGKRYLLRKQGDQERSLGPENDETRERFDQFTKGRDRLQENMRRARERLEGFARVNRALRLNRVPKTASKVLRRLADAGLLGSNVIVAGTNCLFLYESMSGVQLSQDLLATGDVDLLLDGRQRLRLSIWNTRPENILKLLQGADRSFDLVTEGGYRAANKEGYLVDLIYADGNSPHKMIQERGSRSVGDGSEPDLVGVAIEGLQWLMYAPKSEGVVIGEDGRPLRMWAPDPRAFALHKLWLSEREDRRPLSRRRDREQARVVAHLASHYMGMRFDDEVLSALPAALRDRAAEFVAA